MSYAVEQDAIDLYGSAYVLVSVDRDEDGDADVPSFDDALDQATSELDSYIGVAYDLPLVVVPKSLVRFCVDIAIYIASSRAIEMTEEKTTRYERAIKWAEGIAAGDISLGTTDPAAGADEDGGTVLTSFSARLMTRSTMRNLL